MKKKLILFDFDGTVADNSEGIYNCIKYALGKKGMEPLPESILRSFIGPSLFDSFMRHCTDNKETAEELVALYRERYKPLGSTEVRIYDGMKELLGRLKNEGYITAICSSKPYDFVRKIAKEQELEDLFDGFFCPSFGNHISDKTSLALEAITHFGIRKEETVLIGDTKFDVAAAKGAEISSIGVLYGFATEEGELDSADAVAAEINDIYHIIVGDIL
jgi:phosphoglycolate phosphatase